MESPKRLILQILVDSLGHPIDQWVEELQSLLDENIYPMHPEVRGMGSYPGGKLELWLLIDLKDYSLAGKLRDAVQEVMNGLVPEAHPKVWVVGVT